MDGSQLDSGWFKSKQISIDNKLLYTLYKSDISFQKIRETLRAVALLREEESINQIQTYKINQSQMSENITRLMKHISITSNSFTQLNESQDNFQKLYSKKSDGMQSPLNYQSMSPTKNLGLASGFRRDSDLIRSPLAFSERNIWSSNKQFQEDLISKNSSEYFQEVDIHDDEEEEEEDDDAEEDIESDESSSQDNKQKKNTVSSGVGSNQKFKKGAEDQKNKQLISEVDQQADEIEEDGAEGKHEQKLREANFSKKQKECSGDFSRMFKSLNELPSQVIQKESFILGERTPHLYYNMEMDDGIDEVDEIDEEGDLNNVKNTNHRTKLQSNPIYNCSEARLRFRVDSMNANDENAFQHNENEKGIYRNIENLKRNHQNLKKIKLTSQYNKSCINL